ARGMDGGGHGPDDLRVLRPTLRAVRPLAPPSGRAQATSAARRWPRVGDVRPRYHDPADLVRLVVAREARDKPAVVVDLPGLRQPVKVPGQDVAPHDEVEALPGNPHRRVEIELVEPHRPLARKAAVDQVGPYGVVDEKRRVAARV